MAVPGEEIPSCGLHRQQNRQIVNKAGEGVLLDIALGIVGANVGGFLFAQFGAAGVSGLNLYSMFVAMIGAIVVLLIYQAVVRAGSPDLRCGASALMWGETTGVRSHQNAAHTLRKLTDL